ncbi:MAG TPA: HAD family hydrolase [Armatimonadota bacterium]|jgi:putative hydrolase of the HAD superfamily|nr:HAD family hydrolase [Armatimonadota bacterium]
MRYQAVIFDLFGTLIDNLSRAGHENVLREMGDIMGVGREEFVREWVGCVRERMAGRLGDVRENVGAICERLGAQADPKRIDEAVEHKLDYTRQVLTPREGALETLRALRAGGMKTGLLTDCSSEVPKLWEETAFAPLIDEPVFSHSAGLKKPDPRIYHLTCDRLGARPAECLHVGDGSSHELYGAAQVGLDPVRIRVKYEEHEDTYRLDDQEWRGKSVGALLEVPAIAGCEVNE